MIVEKLIKIHNSVNDIQQAINEKGVAIANDVPLSLYANKIREISTVSTSANIEFDVQIALPNTAFKIPSSGWTAGSKIVWGDGNITQNPADNPTHIYSAMGLYHIEIYGHTDIIDDRNMPSIEVAKNNRMITGELKLNPVAGFVKFTLTYTNITRLSGNISTIPDSLLRDAEGLAEIELPNAVSVGKQAFGTLTSNVVMGLKNIVLPQAVNIGENCFFGNSDLYFLHLPEAVELGMEACGKLGKVQVIVLPKVTAIGDYCFDRCSLLTTLKLGADTAVTLNATNVFYGVTTNNINLFLGAYEYAQADLINKTWKSKTWKSINIYS